MISLWKSQYLKGIFSVFLMSISCSIYAYKNNGYDLVSNNNPFSSSPNPINFEEMKSIIWNKYLNDISEAASKIEYNNRILNWKDKSMRFSLEKIGTMPVNGYPLYIALHGGGQTSAAINDSQWEDMKFYYRNSVKNGIYVAPRGITNNWNLHFENESYPLYDKLIESAILYDHVDPNRVYLLGFSAGGDGVYQVVPRMPERFAAANMSAGHHNWIQFDNLYNTPFLMQVGERDTAYKRNQVAAENYVNMNNLNVKYQGGFVHALYIHYNGSHNSWYDNDPSYRGHPVIADPIAWLNNRIRENKLVNTNAIDWLNHYTRHPYPEKLVWDLDTAAHDRSYQTGAQMVGKNGYHLKSLAPPKSLFYWLDVSVAEAYPVQGKLVVEAIKSSNTIKIIEVKNINKFRVLLNPHLLNLSLPIKVEMGDQLIGTLKVKEDRDTMIRTMLERSDVNEIYDSQIILTYNQVTQNWSVSI